MATARCDKNLAINGLPISLDQAVQILLWWLGSAITIPENLMINGFGRSIYRIGAIAITAIWVGLGAAQAGNVRLAWDPSFGAAFPLLGFAGDAVLQYPDGCLATNATLVTISDPCNVPPDEIAFTSVFLDLFDLGTDPTMSGEPVEHLNFLGSTTPSTIQNIIVGGNTVIGLNTFIFGFETTSGAVDSLPAGEDVWLQFVTPFSIVDNCEFDCLVVGQPTAFMFVRPPSGFAGTDLCPNGDGDSSCLRSDPAPVTITAITVPEPGSVVLLLAALGAGFIAFRRRV